MLILALIAPRAQGEPDWCVEYCGCEWVPWILVERAMQTNNEMAKELARLRAITGCRI